MGTETPPEDFEGQELISKISELAEEAIKKGADPQYFASNVYVASLKVAYTQGLDYALKHILLMKDMSESDMQKFYLRYDDVYDLTALLDGEFILKDKSGTVN